MADQLRDYLDGYYDEFHESFPMEQAVDSIETVMKQIAQCLYQRKPAQELYPDIYGDMAGDEV